MSNRRIRRLSASLSSLMASAAQGAGFDPECLPTLLALQVQLNWHLDQHRARKAKIDQRRGGDGWYHGTPASHAVSRPTDPLHTQWLSSTLTPHEYQHLVHRSQRPQSPRIVPFARFDNQPTYQDDYDWWLRVASDIEDHFLYCECAPCGAD